MIDMMETRGNYDSTPLGNILFLIELQKHYTQRNSTISRVRRLQHLTCTKVTYSNVYKEYKLFGKRFKIKSSSEGDLWYKSIKFGKLISTMISKNPEVVLNEKVQEFLDKFDYQLSVYISRNAFNY